jgi:hypothetical protein
MDVDGINTDAAKCHCNYLLAGQVGSALYIMLGKREESKSCC